jgi:hypothetical protein
MAAPATLQEALDNLGLIGSDVETALNKILAVSAIILGFFGFFFVYNLFYFVLVPLGRLTVAFFVYFVRPGKKLKQLGDWAVVTGATDGIGKAYAAALAKQGANFPPDDCFCTDPCVLSGPIVDLALVCEGPYLKALP